MMKKKTLVIDGKEYTVTEDNVNENEVRVVLESKEQHVEQLTYTKQSKRGSLSKTLGAFLMYLIITPVLLGYFGIRFLLGIILLPLGWIILKAGLILSCAVFFAIFQSTLHWISHETAFQVMEFMMTHLLGMGNSKTSTLPMFFPYPTIEWTIIFVLVILMAAVETYELYQQNRTP